MPMNDKQRITIQLADMPRIPLAVNRDEEETARKAEKLVNELWARWSKTFATEPSLKVMARVAFQCAMLYLKMENRQAALEQLDHELDALLHNLPGLEKP